MRVQVQCPHCHFTKEIPAEQIPPRVKWATCPRCHHRFEYPGPGFHFNDVEKNTDSLGPETGGGSEPMPESGRSGPWIGFFPTFKAVLFSPISLFRNMSGADMIGEPIAFGLLFGTFGTLLGFFWQFLMILSGFLPMVQGLIGHINVTWAFIGLMIVSPLYVFLNIFIISGILHVCLVLVGAGKDGFWGTLRVISFAKATQIVLLIPIIGGVVGWVWHVVVQIIGLREIHETSYSRVILAHVIPLVVIIGLVLTPIFLLLKWL